MLYLGDILPYSGVLFEGLWVSVKLTIVAVLAGSLFAIFIYSLKASRYRLLRGIATGYINVIRNTPLLLQLYLIYFALPSIGINLEALVAGAIALVLNNAAYVAEIYRAGFESLPRGISEAGYALGMSSRQVFKDIRLIPALRNVLPSYTNQVILVFLASSIASIISVPELTHIMMEINSKTFRTIEIFIVGGVLYLVVAYAISLLSGWIENHA